MRRGERYSCMDPSCACEIEVVRDSGPVSARPSMEIEPERNPRCSCGQEMVPLDRASGFDPGGAIL